MMDADVVVIGGGAAGLMCALTAGRRGRRVVVLEGANRIGKKILMSGGGRCNFTNLHTGPDNFISANPHFCKSALSRYTQSDFIALVEKHAIAYHEKTLGQLFCDTSSKQIVALLQAECQAANVTIKTHCDEIKIENSAGFNVACIQGRYRCNSLVIATGGLSIPRMGATDFGYRIARQFDLRVLQTRAALVPLTFTGQMLEMSKRLAGLSCRARLSIGNTGFTEDMLFTHRGLSGPAVLQASSYWRPGDSLRIDLLPDVAAADVLLAAKQAQPKTLLRTFIGSLLPRALAVELQQQLWPQCADDALAAITDKTLLNVAATLQNWSLRPAATEGYRTAEVTLGGVDTAHLSSQSMECRDHPGLYFIGEVVDVTGHLGGHNFQWAWSSGHAAGRSA